MVADARHRLPMIEGNPPHPEWVRFFDAAADDAPLTAGVELVRDLVQSGPLVWLTGRPARLRTLTERWLRKYGLPARRLCMQDDDDYRPARVTKLERLAELGGPDRVRLVVDDDPRVIGALDQAGYRTLRADWCPWQPVTDRENTRVHR